MQTVAEAAEQLCITPGAVRDAIAKGKLIPIRLGGRGQRAGLLLIPDEQIARYRERYLGKRGTYRRRKDGEAAETATVAVEGETP